MSREIGSEYHRVEYESGDGICIPREGRLVFSGRTALETVLKEMPDAKKALLPSYCCDSMIEPFRKADFAVSFYPVNFINRFHVEVSIPDDADIFLWCNYFGFKTPMPDMTEFKNRGGVIIEDITHSFFSVRSFHPQSDYLIASIRKWEPIYCGGFCSALHSELHFCPKILPPQAFVDQKKAAMELKTSYLNDMDEVKKPRFLSMYGDSNRWLADNYSELSIDSWSKEYLSHVDMERQKTIRRNNASVLYKGLKNKVQFLFPEEEMDCPLFVPVLLNNRNEVRQRLISNNIYCPIHWPRPEGCVSNLYEKELSLICDQRYNEDDMNRIVFIFNQLA